MFADLHRTLCAALSAVAAGCSDGGVPALQGQACAVPGAVDGPPFEADPQALQGALHCFDAATPSAHPTVLLVHGTSLDGASNFAWNYLPALTARGWPVCLVDLPGFAQDDIQASAEFVVHAIRETARESAGPIQILGFSQGGMLPRWALRHWPDTRALVGELIALAGSNHGTLVATAACKPSCPESNWQQALDSNFITALNRDFETLPGIDYSNVYTHFDQIVQPNLDDSGSSSLAGGAQVANIALQDVCPGHVADHLALGSYDPVGFALALDALERDGPADAARIAPGVCAESLMPGVDPTRFAADYADMLAVIGNANAASARSNAEPPLRCYAGA